MLITECFACKHHYTTQEATSNDCPICRAKQPLDQIVANESKKDHKKQSKKKPRP